MNAIKNVIQVILFTCTKNNVLTKEIIYCITVAEVIVIKLPLIQTDLYMYS